MAIENRTLLTTENCALPEMNRSQGEPVLIEDSTRMVVPMTMALPGDDPRGFQINQGFLVVFDYVSGEIVKTIEVGPEPTNVAFHEQS